MDGVLLRARPMSGRPVVTVAGEDVAQVRDVVYDVAEGSVTGFTLAKRGMFGGPMKKVVLPFANVRGLGPDAVVIDDDEALTPPDGLPSRVDDREILGARVITDDGREVGTVHDLIVRVVGGVADIVGYEMTPSEAFAGSSDHILLPLPDTLSATGDNLVVPATATEYVANDLAGFAGAVDQFRAHLRGDR